MVFGLAAGTGPFDKAIRKEQPLFLIIGLRDFTNADMARLIESVKNGLGPKPVFFAVGGIVLVKTDKKA